VKPKKKKSGASLKSTYLVWGGDLHVQNNIDEKKLSSEIDRQKDSITTGGGKG